MKKAITALLALAVCAKAAAFAAEQSGSTVLSLQSGKQEPAYPRNNQNHA